MNPSYGDGKRSVEILLEGKEGRISLYVNHSCFILVSLTTHSPLTTKM